MKLWGQSLTQHAHRNRDQQQLFQQGASMCSHSSNAGLRGQVCPELGAGTCCESSFWEKNLLIVALECFWNSQQTRSLKQIVTSATLVKILLCNAAVNKGWKHWYKLQEAEPYRGECLSTASTPSCTSLLAIYIATFRFLSKNQILVQWEKPISFIFQDYGSEWLI